MNRKRREESSTSAGTRVAFAPIFPCDSMTSSSGSNISNQDHSGQEMDYVSVHQKRPRGASSDYTMRNEKLALRNAKIMACTNGRKNITTKQGLLHKVHLLSMGVPREEIITSKTIEREQTRGWKKQKKPDRATRREAKTRRKDKEKESKAAFKAKAKKQKEVARTYGNVVKTVNWNVDCSSME